MDTGTLIRKHRSDADMSQAELAQHLKVSEKTVRRWESGEHDVPSKAVVRIAQVFDVPPAALLPKEPVA
jgi:transcriptional regulator with XRE-family HTH domain